MSATVTAKDVERAREAIDAMYHGGEILFAQALADERERAAPVIRDLLKACDELMTEFVSKKRAANWGVINEAMVKGAVAIRDT